MKQVKSIFSLFIFTALFLVACSQTNGVKNITSAEMTELVKSQPGVILDVRTMQEIKKGHLEHAAFMDFLEDDFSSNAEKLPKDKPIYVYCAAGGRSSEAADILHEKGFTQVYNLIGGYRAWAKEGFKTVSYGE